MKVIQALAEGVDPTTGELFPTDSPYNDPRVIRALFQAARALERVKDRERRESALPGSAGKPWSEEEDRLLIQEFDSGERIREIAAKHQRTEGGIASRLGRRGGNVAAAPVHDSA